MKIMGFKPVDYPTGGAPVLIDGTKNTWTPLYWHNCSFTPEVFWQVSMNLIRNPNINSNHLFRADILLEQDYKHEFTPDPIPRILHFDSFDLNTVVIRRLIPRNILVDKPLDQTCLLFSRTDDVETKSLVIYLPHISSPSESPFYHPAVRGIAFLHTFNSESEGSISVHFAFFPSEPQTPILQRTALNLLGTLHKHGQGVSAGYVKRVHHDTIIPQATVQNTYTRLKSKYARALIAAWVEATDPAKHVFEDLGIAAFLIELWAQMYPSGSRPEFVDIGCGNGLLVHILNEEGYSGWGFDARRRKSWDMFTPRTRDNLKELILIPAMLQELKNEESLRDAEAKDDATVLPGIHRGTFAKGSFIISNHADELTPWTPLLAALSESPFLMIPCCSHNLSGARFRAPPPKETGSSSSAYASLVVWVTGLAEDCGWMIEKEMLRIPSTRNTALIGRRRSMSFAEVDVTEVVGRYGGTAGWKENASKLVKTVPRGH